MFVCANLWANEIFLFAQFLFLYFFPLCDVDGVTTGLAFGACIAAPSARWQEPAVTVGAHILPGCAGGLPLVRPDGETRTSPEQTPQSRRLRGAGGERMLSYPAAAPGSSRACTGLFVLSQLETS